MRAGRAYFLSVIFLLIAPLILAGEKSLNIEIIVDSSGSMAEPEQGKRKFEMVREALPTLIGELSTGSNVALRAFGNGSNDCSHIDLLVPMGRKNDSLLEEKVYALTPAGGTPLSNALRKALNDFAGLQGQQNIVLLVTDGKETCRGNPCATVQELRAGGIDVRVHVFGLDVNPQERSQLRCIARAGDGRYFNVRTKPHLERAFARAFGKHSWEGIMEATTLIVTFGLLAFMVERLTNGMATVLGYWSWWRRRMEVSGVADPDTQARIDRNRRVALFTTSAVLAVFGAYFTKLDLFFELALRGEPTSGGHIVTGLLIAAGADPIREFLKLREGRRVTKAAPIEVKGTLVVQQQGLADTKGKTDS